MWYLPAQMPWIEAMLRGQKVFAKATSEGALVAEQGRVEVRYKPNDGRAYRAAASNLVVAPHPTVLPEETCGPAGAAPSKSDSKESKSAAVAKSDAVSVGKDTWVAFTDGACSGNPGPAGAGFVVIEPGGKVHEGYDFIGASSTNNVAELTGVLRALEAIPADAASILIKTDSKYAIGVLSKGWKAKANQELVAETKRLVQSRRARLEYVPGHAGVSMNERADQLAREAVSTRRSKLP
jgi:ribonuclease HI